MPIVLNILRTISCRVETDQDEISRSACLHDITTGPQAPGAGDACTVLHYCVVEGTRVHSVPMRHADPLLGALEMDRKSMGCVPAPSGTVAAPQLDLRHETVVLRLHPYQ
jgi:hypothetical protein